MIQCTCAVLMGPQAPRAGRPVVVRRAPGSGWAARAGSDGASTSSNSDASVGANGTKGKGKVGTKQKEASLALGSLDFELEAPAKVEEAQRSARTQESAAQQLASGRQIVSLRTQLTGGIQSTNVNIDLPEPQVAVRNLVRRSTTKKKTEDDKDKITMNFMNQVMF